MKQVTEEKKKHKTILRYSRINNKIFCVLPSLHEIKKKKLELRIKNIYSFTLTSVSIFSILSFIYTLWHWQGEFV